MIPYAAPIDDMRFVINEVLGLDRLSALPGHEEVSADLLDAVLEEAGKLAGEVLAPLNTIGDQQGSVLENGVVRMPEGFQDAYAQYRDGGWNAVPFEPDYGGQGLPWTVAMALAEMWQSANMSFGLCPMLNQGAVEAITEHGTEDQRQRYLPKLISGHWTGTMNLTEPQAGSDLSTVRTKAIPEDGHYRITGQKIYITYGEHDLADNIIHLVLARLPDAPEGTKGISLFLVPKFLVNEDGSLGQRNRVRCVGLEHKLGIHASPTAVMAYGDDEEGAIGYLVGEANKGLAHMFTMMNNARLAVGIQGVAIAERAYQQALAYAKDRVQGRGLNGSAEKVAIVEHPDVQRMLMTMRGYTEAARALALSAILSLDESKRHPDPETRKAALARVDLLTPVVKAWSTDLGVEVASLGVQVHGGMGFVEETGAAQHYRDARIAPIYEGTNGIQANDLVFRKVLRDGGAAAKAFIAEMRKTSAELMDGESGALHAPLESAIDDLEQATEWLLQHGPDRPQAAAGAASPYLRLFGTVAGGAMLARAARLAEAAAEQTPFTRAKVQTAHFYADNILPLSAGLVAPSTAGAERLAGMGAAALG